MGRIQAIVHLIVCVAKLWDANLDVQGVSPLETIFRKLPDQKVEGMSAQAEDLIKHDVSRESWAES